MGLSDFRLPGAGAEFSVVCVIAQFLCVEPIFSREFSLRSSVCAHAWWRFSHRPMIEAMRNDMPWPRPSIYGNDDL